MKLWCRRSLLIVCTYFEKFDIAYFKKSRGGCSFSKKSVKNFKKVNSLMLTMKKNSIFKIIVYRQTDGLEIYCFHFLFAWVRVMWSKRVYNYFFTVKQYLVIVLSYYRGHKKTSAFSSFYRIIPRYIRDQVLFMHFLLKRY